MNAKSKANIACWIVLLSFLIAAYFYKHYFSMGFGMSVVVTIVMMLVCYVAIRVVEASYKGQNAKGMKPDFRIGGWYKLKMCWDVLTNDACVLITGKNRDENNSCDFKIQHNVSDEDLEKMLGTFTKIIHDQNITLQEAKDIINPPSKP